MKPTKLIVPILLSLSLVIAAVSASAKKNDASALLKAVEKNYLSESESAMVTMKIIEKNGSSKKYKMNIKRKGDNSGSKHKAIVRILAPPKLRGTGLLSVNDNGSKEQRIYLPSKKKSRKILSSGQGDGFMGSELSYEDLGGGGATQFKGRILRHEKKRGQDVAVVEITPEKGESAYSKIISWIPTKRSVVIKTEYYDKKGKLKKIASFKNYKKFNSIWRAQQIHIVNKQNQRQTVLELEDLKVNKGIRNSEFTKAALEDY